MPVEISSPTADDNDEVPRSSAFPSAPCLFPPALVPILRERLGDDHPSLVGIADELLVDLLTVVFFAGLQTHEGSHNPVRVAFSGRIASDILLQEGAAQSTSTMLHYRWSTLRIEPDRPFSVLELVKLAVATRADRTFTKVELSRRGLRIAGLTREGLNRRGDPCLKVLSLRPGMLSIRSGGDHLIEYQHGRIDVGPLDVIVEPGPVRRALEAAARKANLGAESMTDYLDTVRALVREMAAHGRGGILVISGQSHPDIPVKASYRTTNDSTIAQLLPYLDGAADARRAAHPGLPTANTAVVELRRVLRTAFATEAERWVSEFGGFTAMDGATVLDCGLGVRGFGVVLPVAQDIDVAQAEDTEATVLDPYDLSSRGTRHRAAATHAKTFPGSVVFVASHDGPVSCLLGEGGGDRVVLWRMGSGELL